jgi:hypothetical protein
MFISGTLNLESPLPNSTLKSAAKNAWRNLRFEVPELVAGGHCDEDGKAFMEYQTPRGEDEVNKWVNRTASFDQVLDGLDFEGLREKILQMKRVFDSEAAPLLLYSELGSDEDSVSPLHVMLNVDHEVTDGIGSRILFGKYLSLLAKFLSISPGVGQDDIDWTESSQNLSPPWISIMNEEQITSRSEYEEHVQLNKIMLFEHMVSYVSITYLSTTALE